MLLASSGYFSWCLDKSFCLKLLFQLTGSNCLCPEAQSTGRGLLHLLWHCILDSLSVCPQSASSHSGGCASFRNCLHPSQGQSYPGQGFCFRSSLDRHSYSFRPVEQGARVCGPYMETAEHFRGGSGMEMVPYHSPFLAFSRLHLGP